jgi:hypothetical protein
VAEIEESKVHAAMFAKIPTAATKCFSVLTKIEKRHAQLSGRFSHTPCQTSVTE